MSDIIGVGHGSDHDLAKQDSTPPRVIFYACRLARGEVPAYLLLDPGYLRRHEARRHAGAVRPGGGRVMLTPEDLAAYRAREGGKDKLTDAVIEAAEAYLWLRANAWRVRGVYLDEEVRAAMRAEKGEGNE